MRFTTLILGSLVPLAVLGIFQLIRFTQGQCCYSKTVNFDLVHDTYSCKYYDDAKTIDKKKCEVDICEDGSSVDGKYCGHGPCNMFGCRCEGGCRKGNGLQTFADYYGDYYIRNVRYV